LGGTPGWTTFPETRTIENDEAVFKLIQAFIHGEVSDLPLDIWYPLAKGTITSQ